MKILKNKNIKSFIHMLAAYKKQHIVAMIFSVLYATSANYINEHN